MGQAARASAETSISGKKKFLRVSQTALSCSHIKNVDLPSGSTNLGSWFSIPVQHHGWSSIQRVLIRFNLIDTPTILVDQQ